MKENNKYFRFYLLYPFHPCKFTSAFVFIDAMIEATIRMIDHVDRRRYRVVHLGGDRQRRTTSDRWR